MKDLWDILFELIIGVSLFVLYCYLYSRKQDRAKKALVDQQTNLSQGYLLGLRRSGLLSEPNAGYLFHLIIVAIRGEYSLDDCLSHATPNYSYIRDGLSGSVQTVFDRSIEELLLAWDRNPDTYSDIDPAQLLSFLSPYNDVYRRIVSHHPALCPEGEPQSPQ